MYIQYHAFCLTGNPKNMFAAPMKSSYNVGDQITCYADSFPESSYVWQNIRTMELHTSQAFLVTGDMAGHNTTMRCQAQNVIQGFLYSNNVFISVLVPGIDTLLNC